MPVEDLSSMMQLKQQLSHQISQLNAMLGQNPNMANMMNQNNMNNSMGDSGSMIRPNIMLPNYNNMTPNNWNAQVHFMLRFFALLVTFFRTFNFLLRFRVIKI
jgi:hypothetical protein